MRATSPPPRMVEPLILQALEQLAERLDDGLEFTQQLVDHQAGFLAAVADDHDVFPAPSGALYVEIVLQPDKGSTSPRRLM